MLYEKLQEFSQQTGVPVAYRFFMKPQAPPFVAYYENGTNNFGADNVAYYGAISYTVELYTEKKDPALERALESCLSPYFWQRSETYIDTEKMYMQIYTLEE